MNLLIENLHKAKLRKCKFAMKGSYMVECFVKSFCSLRGKILKLMNEILDKFLAKFILWTYQDQLQEHWQGEHFNLQSSTCLKVSFPILAIMSVSQRTTPAFIFPSLLSYFNLHKRRLFVWFIYNGTWNVWHTPCSLSLRRRRVAIRTTGKNLKFINKSYHDKNESTGRISNFLSWI